MAANTSSRDLDAGQRSVLESIARGTDLQRVLDEIVLLIERQSPGMTCSILLLENGVRLRHGAAPNIPPEYARAIDGSEIGPSAGSCGTAAYTGKRVIIEDIATHPFWANYRQFALPHGLVACWSTPIVDRTGNVLGTFAMYYNEKRKPALHEIEWVDVATHLASIAILRHRTEQELRRSEARARDLARLHEISSSLNKLLARARDAQHVYDLACRVAVETGLARLAWLGLFENDNQRLNVVSQYGEVPLLDVRSVDLSDPTNQGGLATRAMSTGLPAVAQDLLNEAPPQWRAALAERGLRSCALFPLKERDRLFGVFTLYAAVPAYFRTEEVQVLTSLVADISFGIESARNDLERQRMEEGLRASEALRAHIYDTVTDGIFYLDCEEGGRYRFRSINRAFTEIFAAPEDRVIGKVLNDLLPETMREAVLERYQRACTTGKRISWEQVSQSRAGERHVEVTIAPLYDATGRCAHFVGTVHDLTARVQAEAERARLVTQLNQAQRMQSLGTLAGGIAHDFNNILAAISGNAGLALQEEAVEPPVRVHLLEIQKASSRAIDLVRQILTFSRHTPPKREIVEPLGVIREAMNLLRATLSQTIALETHYAEDTPTIEGDSTQLHQVVMNLGTNAAHAVPSRDGVIRVLVDRYDIAESDPPVAGLMAGRYMRLQVIDNGCGMDEATLKRAFDPFFTTRQPGEGTGLGLSVVHGIVQSHHGVVEIRSRLQEGTTVVVYLPAGTQPIQEKISKPSAKGKGERIMYVDDEEALVFLMDRALTKMGYAVSGFSDPTAALNAFRLRPSEFDVVVTDVSMPGLSGPDLVAELRNIRADVPIIMTSGYLRPEDIESAERLKINQLVYKSNTIEELGEVVAKEIAALGKTRARSSS